MHSLVCYILYTLHEEQYSSIYKCTVFENDRKGLIQHCERSELCSHFEILSFCLIELCLDGVFNLPPLLVNNQTNTTIQRLKSKWTKQLPDRSGLKGRKMPKNGKIKMRHFEQFLNNVICSSTYLSLILSWNWRPFLQ